MVWVGAGVKDGRGVSLGTGVQVAGKMWSAEGVKVGSATAGGKVGGCNWFRVEVGLRKTLMNPTATQAVVNKIRTVRTLKHAEKNFLGDRFLP